MQTGYMTGAMDTIDIHDMCGQGYDNGANIKEKNYGLRKKIIDLNIRAFFVPCAAQSLNLVQLTFQMK
jgi:hypothetical protein